MNSGNTINSDNEKTSGIARLRPSSVKNTVASLIGSEDTEPKPESFARGTTERYSTAIDRAKADPGTEAYYTEFEKNPIISTQIEGFSADVFEAGWWITAKSEKTKNEIEEYCHNIGIQAGKPHQELSQLGEQIIVQHQARGTFLGEKVKDERGRHVALNPINPTTMEIYTKQGVNMLVPPNYTADDDDDALIKHNENGETAAYVQYDQQFTRWDNRSERYFTRDEVMHWARRPDIGDVFGNSRIEPVLERSRALREKLQDNDLAIAMKAWPMIMFQMGTEERPWTLDEMDDFMEDYTQNELGPGMFQGVPGDIEVHEFAGETADIAEPVMTDVNMIVSAMPGPKHSTGSFPGEEGSPTEAHERQYMKLVRKTRRDLENLLTSYLQDVADSWGYDSTDLELHIGRPDGEVAPEDVQGSVIRYQSDVDDEGEERDPSTDGRNVTPVDGDGGDETGEAARGHDPAVTEAEAGAGDVDDDPRSVGMYTVDELADPDFEVPDDADELEDPRMVHTSDIVDDLGQVIADTLIDARDNTLDVLELRHNSRRAPDGHEIEAEYEGQVGSASRSQRLVSSVSDSCDETLEATLETLSQSSHSPTIQTVADSTHRSLSSSVNESILNDISDLGEKLGTEFRRQTNQIGESERDLDAVRDRIESTYSDETLEARSKLIAQMRTQELLNRVRLYEYRNHQDVDGIKVISTCGDDVHSVTAELAGCDGGDPATAWFDDEESIGEQLQDGLDTSPPPGFDPLDDVPPYHFGDRSEIAPMIDD